LSVVVLHGSRPCFGQSSDLTSDCRSGAHGTVPPELLARARKLRWICAARAGLGGAWFYDALVNSDVLVTNMCAATTCRPA
jgi:hypothetical protein